MRDFTTVTNYRFIGLILVFLLVGCIPKQEDIGNPISVQTGNGMTDVEGNFYPSVIYGNGQEWIIENLRTSTYANGDPIGQVIGSWLQLYWDGNYYVLEGAWTYYEDDSVYNYPHGKLYNLFAVKDPRGLCPNGWHISSESDWWLLIDYLGGKYLAAGRMNVRDQQYWNGTVDAFTNESRFSGIASGRKSSYVTQFWFSGMKGSSAYWTSTPTASEEMGIAFELGNRLERIGNPAPNHDWGMSCRCVKDS